MISLSLYEFIFSKGFIAFLLYTSTSPAEVLDPTKMEMSLSEAGLDHPCIIIVRDSSEDVLPHLEASSNSFMVRLLYYKAEERKEEVGGPAW